MSENEAESEVEVIGVLGIPELNSTSAKYQNVENINEQHLPPDLTLDNGVMKFGFTTTPVTASETIKYNGENVINWIVDREKLRITGKLESEIYHFFHKGVTATWQLVFSSAHLYQEQRWVSLLLKLVQLEGAPSAAMQVRLEIDLNLQEDVEGTQMHAECSGVLRVGDSRGPKLVRLAAAPVKLRANVTLQTAPLAPPFCMTLVPGRHLTGSSDAATRECRVKVLWDICQWQSLDSRHGAEVYTPLFGACGTLFRLCLRPNGDHLQPVGSISLSLQADYLPGELRKKGVCVKMKMLLTNRLMEHADIMKEGEVRGGCFGLRTDLLQHTDLLIQVEITLLIPEHIVPQTEPTVKIQSRPLPSNINV